MSENNPIGIEILVLTYNRAPFIGSNTRIVAIAGATSFPYLRVRQWQH